MRYAQLVMGPAGCGKSTYCPRVVQHSVDNKMTVEVMNLDPVAEYFDYQPLVDIGKGGGGGLHAVAQLVQALRYKCKGHGFDSRWCHWNFSLT